ncbi:MAG: hypothetical protein KF760_01795 [Candidatus Eremiobacteraeota bacterium]|nr:hypothetical protein [Candidatus Eremiobacteraeota bacterium]MCW5871864.1 hypothetical protein [Candidatus Eremiobacteraeota bacterium]
MRRSILIVYVFLAILLTLGALGVIFYDHLPWIGTHFIHKNPGAPTRWSVLLQIQQGSALGTKVSLDEVPAPSKEAELKGTFVQQGETAGQEWSQQLRMESLESVQYSWEQKENKELLKCLLEARVGPSGGLRNLEVKPPSRSLWLRQDLLASWLQTLWPQFPGRGLEPKASWNSSVPFKIQARELANPVDARWDCTWTFRGMSHDAAVPLAMIDVQATAGSQGQALDGTLRAEVAYALSTQQVAATRGSFQLRYAIPTQATEQSTVVLQECLQIQFQTLRLIQNAAKTP